MNNKSDQLAAITSEPAVPGHKSAGTALLIIDMISDFDFKHGEKLFHGTLPAARNIAQLSLRARSAEIPVIYVNDNYGVWQNDLGRTIKAARGSVHGERVVSLIEPKESDYHILKPQRSGFFLTPLEMLLSVLKVNNLVITGITTDICVFFTVHDAYMRGYNVTVPSDCCAAIDQSDHNRALDIMERVAQARIENSNKLFQPSSSALDSTETAERQNRTA